MTLCKKLATTRRSGANCTNHKFSSKSLHVALAYFADLYAKGEISQVTLEYLIEYACAVFIENQIENQVERQLHKSLESLATRFC
jgi:hypothetical protein